MDDDKLVAKFVKFLDTDWRADAENMDVLTLKNALAEVAKSEEANRAKLEQDEALKAAKERVSELTEDYNHVTKVNKLKTKYLVRVLSTKE